MQEITQGMVQTLRNLAIKKQASGKSIEKIAEELETSVEQVKEMLRVTAKK